MGDRTWWQEAWESMLRWIAYHLPLDIVYYATHRAIKCVKRYKEAELYQFDALLGFMSWYLHDDYYEKHDMCTDCGHSRNYHQTRGGFCRHCTCNKFVGKKSR